MLADYKFIPCNSAERSESPELQLLGSNNPRGRHRSFGLYSWLPCISERQIFSKKSNLLFELLVDRKSLPKRGMLQVRPARPRNPKCLRHRQLESFAP